ncbi:hypothetical protein X962_5037 [Burkholderia pseudomallei MSHR7343]|nr:hypothetical protein X962_5037 [Burkholderia pseudomallei MSHR7343]KGW36470.1 hypothetical protein Y047_5557 [Burkholderia pseudomallei MSHR3016]KGX56443.1 hypothetical protein Y024_4632 [Burkholderia pseudomallei TSV44]
MVAAKQARDRIRTERWNENEPDASHDAGTTARNDHLQKRRSPIGAKIVSSLDQAPVKFVKSRENRQNHKGGECIDEADQSRDVGVK